MNRTPFKSLFKNDLYQVFLFSSWATVPFNFARHPWLVVNKMGEVSRWEIFWEPDRSETSWGHLHKDFYPPEQGIEMFFFTSRYLWPGRLDARIEGGPDSAAAKLVERVTRSPELYARCNIYSLFGPNSVTYVQWAISETQLRLPWNSYPCFFKK